MSTTAEFQVWKTDARRDDWHTRFVGSDIRQMLGEIERLSNSHAALVKALDDLDTLLDFSDENVDSTWHFDSTDAIQNAFKQAYAVLSSHRSAKP